MKSKVSCAEKALLYGLPPLSAAGSYVRGVLRELGVEAVTVDAVQISQTAGALAGLPADGGPAPAKGAAAVPAPREPFILLCGLPQQRFEALLAALRGLGAQNPLKAVLTPFNSGWRFCDLMAEVAAERDRMMQKRF